MRVSFCGDYFVPLPDDHPFPMGKFPALHTRLVREGLLGESEVVTPRQADWADLRRVHTPKYLRTLAQGTLSPRSERRLGLPWSRQLVRRSRLAVQGTINAAFMALRKGVAANLAGGTHHALPDHGEGFCVLNDVAVAIRVLQASRWVRRVLILDLDVHQGNGNAAFFREDESVFTFSIHGKRNYPFEKPPSSVDIPLEDGTEDEKYLDVLRSHLPQTLDAFEPNLVFYLAGVDVAAGDRFGRLALTPIGLTKRDHFVLEQLHGREIPVALLLSSGYARTPEDTAELHAITHREAVRVFGFSGVPER